MPGREKYYLPPTATSIIINVHDGKPDQTSVDLPRNKRIIFVNLDEIEYLIELWNMANNDHIFVCPLLPANGSVTFIADMDDYKPGDKCYYNIETVDGCRRRRDPDDRAFDGGGHVIIIGN